MSRTTICGVRCGETGGMNNGGAAAGAQVREGVGDAAEEQPPQGWAAADGQLHTPVGGLREEGGDVAGAWCDPRLREADGGREGEGDQQRVAVGHDRAHHLERLQEEVPRYDLPRPRQTDGGAEAVTGQVEQELASLRSERLAIESFSRLARPGWSH